MELAAAVVALQKFGSADLTQTLGKIEASLIGVAAENSNKAIVECGANEEVLAAAALVKAIAGRINDIVHALGILLCLPHLLEPGECIEYVSLASGNTGRSYDLETSIRVAEFKFIHWRGGPESIRQNQLFKDFFLMAEGPSSKRKHLYVLGTEYPLKFFHSGRALSSVLSKDDRIKSQFAAKFGDTFKTVREYYSVRKDAVLIEDVSGFVPPLLGAISQLEEGDR